jgi:hypothetical protein
MVMVLDIQGTRSGIAATIGHIRNMNGVRQTYERSWGEGDARIIAVVDRPGVCRAATGAAIICFDCPFNSTEVPAKWRFVVKKPDDIGQVLRRLGGEDIEAEVKMVTPFDRPSDSAADEAVIRAAIENGYFDYPRRISLKGLSRMMGLPPEKLARILGS